MIRQTATFDSKQRTFLNFLYLSCFFLILSSRGWSISSSTSGWYFSGRKPTCTCLADFSFLIAHLVDSRVLIPSSADWASLIGTILDLSSFLCVDFRLNLTRFRDIFFAIHWKYTVRRNQLINRLAYSLRCEVHWTSTGTVQRMRCSANLRLCHLCE